MNTKLIFFIALLFFSTISAINAQENEARLDSLIDEVLGTDKDLYELLDGNIKYHFLYFNTDYSNKTLFAGQEIGEKMYNFSGQLFYFISNGLYLGASGTWYSQMDPEYRMTAFTAGYSDGTKNWRYRMSYARYVYSIPGYDPDFSNSIKLGTTYKYKNIGVRGDYSLAFGKDYNHQASFDLFSKILLFKLGSYDKVRLEPQISSYFGFEEFDKDIATGDVDSPWYEPEYVTKNEFGLMNIEIEVPLSVYYKDFMFEVAYSYNFPRSLDRTFELSETQFFRVSLGYIFSLN